MHWGGGRRWYIVIEGCRPDVRKAPHGSTTQKLSTVAVGTVHTGMVRTKCNHIHHEVQHVHITITSSPLSSEAH